LVSELWLTSVMGGLLLYLRLSVAPATPHFTVADNPIAHSPKTLTRILSMGKVWATHAKLLIFPNSLSFDWSSESIPLIDNVLDWSNLETFLLMTALFGLSYRSLRGLVDRRKEKYQNCGKLCISHQICHDKYNNNVVSRRFSHHHYNAKFKSYQHAVKMTPKTPGKISRWQSYQKFSFCTGRDGCSPEHVS
ncbi:protein of unknown function DUF1736, partial [Trinorchestia longiramus]